MKVWIDHDLCTGDAQCAEICPDVFFMHEDERGYRSYVRDIGSADYGPDGAPKPKTGDGLADVPEIVKYEVREAAEYCPGECIFVEGD